MADAAFDRVETQNVDFPALERGILKFWDEQQIFEQRRKRNAGKPKWSFLDGPITANNPMGVHHAWGRTYKDAYNRYFAMTGHDLRYQNGFDCQGLWVEVEVEKELGLKSKRDIENLVPGDSEASIDKFVQACKDRVNKFARVQTDQSIRLGYWMDWDRTDADWAKSPDDRKSYFTMAERNNFTIWSFLKKCHGKKLIYRGYDVMPWCGRCGVGLSEMEMKEGYKLVEHRSVFVKFPLKGRPNENLLVWTTTPWTLTSNVGAAINPELTYLQVKLKDEIYYVAKGAFKLNRMESAGDEDEDASVPGKKSKKPWLDGVPHLSSIEQHFKSKAGKGSNYEIVGEVKGETMLGWEYEGPFDDLPAQQHEFGFPEDVAKVTKQSGKWPAKTAAQSHRVISGGKDVTETEGTGIVHTAPGCGSIDFAWGKENGLPPVAPIDDAGTFHEGFGPLTGKNAADPATADAVFEELKKKDRLFTTERYVHRYPHCWRCKTELLYRLVDEWFINMGEKKEPLPPTPSPRRGGGEESPSPLRGGVGEGSYSFRRDILKVVDRVTFLPESINGQAREKDWLKNMGDWMISKKRFWGLALPIWVNDNDPTDFEVIGSREELKARAVEGWTEFDGHTPHRPWIDRIKIRNAKGELMSRIPDVGNPWLDAGIVAYSTLPAEWRPADFITESFPGQFRNWFYALLAMSTMMSDGQEPPFKTLLGHGLVRDEHGDEMHKSKGNSIEFNSAAEQMGADAMRWLYCRSNPAANLNFGTGPINEVRAKFIIKLWNCYGFFCNYAALDGFEPTLPPVPVKDRADIDRWILSDLQLLIQKSRAEFEAFNVMGFCTAVEEFVDAKLSNWYIRRNRDRFWSNDASLDDVGRKDKLAAYQTLHTVLMDLCRLCAPVVPYLTEVMWKNLTKQPATSVAGSDSVHLAEYPQPDASLIDTQLSEDMDAVLRIVSLGGAARNAAKHKTRQPLAELRVQPGSDADRRAVERFPGLITDELNVKRITLHTGEAMLKSSAKLNKKTAAAKLGANLKQAEATLDAMGAEQLRAANFVLVGVQLEPADIAITHTAPEGWCGVVDKSTQAMIDGRITPELKLEGLSRDVIRLVQDERKKAGLDVADKIELHLGAEGELAAAVAAHKDAIAADTQVVKWHESPFGDSHAASAKVDGQPLAIHLKKA
ncbi:MAG: class I tRNA ligase family protein [Gemmataceae bacterium]